MNRPLPVLLAAALALGACARDTGLPEDPWTALAPAGAGAGPRPVSAAAALVHLPIQAGAVVAVGEERTRDRHRQRIVWPGDRQVAGENFAEVEIGIGARRPANPTDEAIRREAAAALPAGRTAGEPRFGENALGPYGAVLDGTGPAARCLYAWQSVEPDGARSLLATLGPEPARASIRWRLCRSGLGEAGLLALLDGAGPGAGGMPAPPVAAAPTSIRPVRIERRLPAPAAIPARPVAPRPADRVAAGPAIPMP